MFPGTPGCNGMYDCEIPRNSEREHVNLNRIGPSVDPCGTPQVRGTGEDEAPITTEKFRPVK